MRDCLRRRHQVLSPSILEPDLPWEGGRTETGWNFTVLLCGVQYLVCAYSCQVTNCCWTDWDKTHTFLVLCDGWERFHGNFAKVGTTPKWKKKRPKVIKWQWCMFVIHIMLSFDTSFPVCKAPCQLLCRYNTSLTFYQSSGSFSSGQHHTFDY